MFRVRVALVVVVDVVAAPCTVDGQVVSAEAGRKHWQRGTVWEDREGGLLGSRQQHPLGRLQLPGCDSSTDISGHCLFVCVGANARALMYEDAICRDGESID